MDGKGYDLSFQEATVPEMGPKAFGWGKEVLGFAGLVFESALNKFRLVEEFGIGG